LDKSQEKSRIKLMPEEQQRKMEIADDENEGIGLLLRLRIPWLVLGLIGGVAASFLVSRFESVLSENISLAFFLPLIVYMSDAVGTQTQTIFVRDLTKGTARFTGYLLKEFILGVVVGIVFGAAIGIVAYFWLNSTEVAWTVGLAMAVNIAIAPVVALIVPELLFKEHSDPALGGGPFTTIIQDIISIMVYLLVASLILFS
jgi:magnesium transporter